MTGFLRRSRHTAHCSSSFSPSISFLRSSEVEAEDIEEEDGQKDKEEEEGRFKGGEGLREGKGDCLTDSLSDYNDQTTPTPQLEKMKAKQKVLLMFCG